MAAKLKAEGIASLIHYPIPIHLLPAFSTLGYPRGAFPITEQYAGQILSLPMFPELTEEEIHKIVDTI